MKELMDMKTLMFAVLLALAAPLHADTETEIRTMVNYFAEVWSEGDLESIRSYYHPEFVLIDQRGVTPLSGRIAELETITGEGKDHGDLSYSEIVVDALAANTAMAYGKFGLKFKDGSSLSGWFTTVYEKTPFGWKAILTHN